MLALLAVGEFIMVFPCDRTEPSVVNSAKAVEQTNETKIEIGITK